MNFDNIIGNDKIKLDLNKIIQTNNVLHSYMFVGQEGIGKKLFAIEFAKKILCINKEFKDCSSCIKFDSKNHPDFFIINEEGETIKVEQIRNLVDKINEKPIVSERKVYIINDSEKMTVDAANCLLKTLEEPPEYAVLILIVSNVSMLLNTIKSRCIKIKFSQISNEALEEYLKKNYNVDEVSKNLLTLCDGSIGKALNALEKKEIYKQIDDFVDSLETKDFIEILNNSKFIYDKENINQILDYMIVCFYGKIEKNHKFMNCINYVSDSMRRLKLNSNFDMTIDNLLLNVWEGLRQ